MLQRDRLPIFHSKFVIACVQNIVWYFVVLVVVVVLAGVLDLVVLLFVINLLVRRLLLGYTWLYLVRRLSYSLFLSISFYTLRLWRWLLSSIVVDSALDSSIFLSLCPSIAQLDWSGSVALSWIGIADPVVAVEGLSWGLFRVYSLSVPAPHLSFFL